MFIVTTRTHRVREGYVFSVIVCPPRGTTGSVYGGWQKGTLDRTRGYLSDRTGDTFLRQDQRVSLQTGPEGTPGQEHGIPSGSLCTYSLTQSNETNEAIWGIGSYSVLNTFFKLRNFNCAKVGKTITRNITHAYTHRHTDTQTHTHTHTQRHTHTQTQIITARIRSMTGRYCFHRCLSVNISGGGGYLVSDFQGGVPGLRFLGEVPGLRFLGGVPGLRFRGGYLVSDFLGGGGEYLVLVKGKIFDSRFGLIHVQTGGKKFLLRDPPPSAIAIAMATRRAVCLLRSRRRTFLF